MSILLFSISILLPLYLGRLVWKRLDVPEDSLDDQETLTRLLQRVLAASLTVVLGMGFCLWILDVLWPKTLL